MHPGREGDEGVALLGEDSWTCVIFRDVRVGDGGTDALSALECVRSRRDVISRAGSEVEGRGTRRCLSRERAGVGCTALVARARVIDGSIIVPGELTQVLGDLAKGVERAGYLRRVVDGGCSRLSEVLDVLGRFPSHHAPRWCPIHPPGRSTRPRRTRSKVRRQLPLSTATLRPRTPQTIQVPSIPFHPTRLVLSLDSSEAPSLHLPVPVDPREQRQTLLATLPLVRHCCRGEQIGFLVDDEVVEVAEGCEESEARLGYAEDDGLTSSKLGSSTPRRLIRASCEG